MFEIYAPDSYTNNLSGGTIMHGTKEWTNVIGTLSTTLSDWRTAFIAATGFTTFSIKASHYDGSSVLDIYEADESTAFPGSATYSETSWSIPAGTWKIENALFAPEESLYGDELLTDLTMDGEMYDGTESIFTKSDLSVGIHEITLRVQDDDGLWSDNASKSLEIREITDTSPVDDDDDDWIPGFELVFLVSAFLITIGIRYRFIEVL